MLFLTLTLLANIIFSLAENYSSVNDLEIIGETGKP